MGKKGKFDGGKRGNLMKKKRNLMGKKGKFNGKKGEI